MKNNIIIKKYILIFLFIFTISITTNNVNAYKKNEVPQILNNILQTRFNIEKRNQFLHRDIVKTFINKKINPLYINIYINRVIYKNEYNDNYIIQGGKGNNINLLKIKYNKYIIYNKELLKKKKEKIREIIIKKILDKGLAKIDSDIRQFKIDINYKGEITVNKNKANNKIDLIKLYIDQIFNREKEKFLKLNEGKTLNDINKNIYYNYLYDNTIISQIEIPIDLSYLSNSLLIRDIKDFNNYFKVSSFRFRTAYKYDKKYRQFNIKQVYNTIPNNMLVIYPQQVISFNNIYLKNDTGSKYKLGTIIKDGKTVEDIYGGGVCGAATGMYQGLLFNNNLETNVRNHSIWYNLYRANINRHIIYTPGLDATYYTNAIDLHIKNTGKYPIVLINRITDNIEENFTLSMKYEKNDKINGISFIKRNDNCFLWKIGNKYRKSCYKEIASEKLEKEIEKEKLIKKLKKKN